MFEKLKSKFKVFQQKLRSFKLGRKGLKSENGDVQGPANCISCDGKVGSDQTNPCGHYYCQECLSEMAGLALKDKSLIPIRCCRQPLSQDNLVKVLNTEDLRKYEDLQKSPSLVSRFILDQDYRTMIRSNGWRLCPSCGAGIEKIDGCHHVVCPCGRDFNYDRKKAALFYAAKTAIAFGGAVLIILAIVFAPVLVVIHYSWTDRPLKILKNCVGFIMDLLGFD